MKMLKTLYLNLFGCALLLPGVSPVGECGLLIAVASLVAEHGL